MPARVFVGVGSNIDGRWNIQQGIRALRAQLGELIISPIYESEPVGIYGNNFYNLVIGFDSNQTWVEIVAALHEIESRFGRNCGGEDMSSLTLDLDLLLYGDLVVDEGNSQLPRPDILQYAFVLKPLADVAGDYVHPIAGRSYRELWHAFDRRGQRLWPVVLETG